MLMNSDKDRPEVQNTRDVGNISNLEGHDVSKGTSIVIAFGIRLLIVDFAIVFFFRM